MRELIRGRYEELEVVGSGGQGRVIKALDHLHDRTVALKRRTMHDPAEREALLAEAGVLFRLPPSPHLPSSERTSSTATTTSSSWTGSRAPT